MSKPTPEQMVKLLTLADAMADPDTDFGVEEVAPFVSCVRTLMADGVRFHPTFAEWIDWLAKYVALDTESGGHDAAGEGGFREAGCDSGPIPYPERPAFIAARLRRAGEVDVGGG